MKKTAFKLDMSASKIRTLRFTFITLGFGLVFALALDSIKKLLTLAIGDSGLLFVLCVILLIAYPFFYIVYNIKKDQSFYLRNSVIWVAYFLALVAVIYRTADDFLLHPISSGIIFALFLLFWEIMVLAINKKAPVTQRFMGKYQIAYFIFLLFAIGILVIQAATIQGSNHIDLVLRKCSDTSIILPNASFSCHNSANMIYANSEVICNNLNPGAKNVTSYLKFILKNGTTLTVAGGESLKVQIPEDVETVKTSVFYIINNASSCATVSNNQSFPTISESEGNERQFTLYSVSYISFLLVTLPVIIKNWKNLLQN